MLAPKTGIFNCLHLLIPGFNFFQAPARLLIWYTVAMAVLAGIGAQSFRLSRSSRLNWQRVLIACFGLIIAGFAGDFILTGRSQTFVGATTRLGIWLALSIVFLLIPTIYGR